MVLILIIALLVLGIVYYQAMQGLFSSVIMAILTVICAAVALNFYEALGQLLLYTRQPAYADALSLVALFVLLLLILRIVLDKVIGGNVVLNHWIDRIGGAAFGFVTGVFCVGIFALTLQMLPLGPSIMGYRPYDERLQRLDRLVPFYPDENIIKFGRMLSAGAFGTAGETPTFAEAHDDLLLELYCWRNRPMRSAKLKGRKQTIHSRMGRLDAMPDDLQVDGAWECPDEYLARWCPKQVHPLLEEGNNLKTIVVRAVIHADAREDEDAGQAVNWFVLPATHFRLVGATGRSFYPVGYLTYLDKNSATARTEASSLGKNVSPRDWKFIGPTRNDEDTAYRLTDLSVDRPWLGKGKALVVDWVYRIGEKEIPSYMVFRRTAKADVPKLPAIKKSAGELFSKKFADKALGRKL